jgi:hypothetical protein
MSAKQYKAKIEQLEKELKEAKKQGYSSARSQSKGCFAKLVIVLIILGVVTIFMLQRFGGKYLKKGSSLVSKYSKVYNSKD